MRIGVLHPMRRPPRVFARAVVLTAASFAAASCLPHPGSVSPRLSEQERAVHLLSRATYGVRPQDVEEVLRIGRKEWLERQLRPESIEDPMLAARRAQPAATAPTTATIRMTTPQPANPTADSARQRAVAELSAATLQQLAAVQRQVMTAQEQIAAAGRQSTEAALQQLVGATQQLNQARQQLNAVQQALTSAQRQVPAVQRNQVVAIGAALAASQTIGGLVLGKLVRSVYSERQLEEVMTDFWFNHFNVFYGKSTQIRPLIADYEENAIRRNVFGRFEDMLAATAQHAAMMIYLDNNLSSAPPPAGGVAAAAGRPVRQTAQRGLNENYARELMELHTLGVDGGYTQQDVIEVARAFTGWATEGTGTNLRFAYLAERHDDGAKVVLGRTFPGGQGMEEGKTILTMLARHPATAEHIATKLVRHFVSDDPPADLVAELARVFRESDGDLRAVTRALFLSDRFYDGTYYRAKVKRPFEFVASAIRVSGTQVANTTQIAPLTAALTSFKHLPYQEPAPTGYATTADEWVSGAAMLARVNFALDLTGGRINGLTLDPWAPLGEEAGVLQARFDSGVGAPEIRAEALRGWAAALLQRTHFGVSAPELETLIVEDLSRQEMTLPTRALMARAVTLALGSPEFQRY